MKFRLSLISVLTLSISFPCFTQQVELEKLDNELSRNFREMIAADYDVRYDSLGPQFTSQLKEALLQPETIAFPFDSLSAEIRIVQSPDGHIRTYSWDERTGGSWHDMAAIVQFRTTTGEVKVQQLDSDDEAMTGAYTDVIIYEMHELLINAQKYYLSIGWGTHGSGHHHSMIQIFRIEGEDFVKCHNCFEEYKDLVVVAPRRNKINLQFDPDRREITHNEFEYDDEIGFYRPTGQTVIMKLIDDVFQKQ